MTTNDEIAQIEKKLEEHETRIQSLENLAKGRSKRVLTKRKSITDHLTYLKMEGFLISLKP